MINWGYSQLAPQNVDYQIHRSTPANKQQGLSGPKHLSDVSVAKGHGGGMSSQIRHAAAADAVMLFQHPMHVLESRGALVSAVPKRFIT